MPYRPPVQADRLFACGTRADGTVPILQISSLRFDASYRRHLELSDRSAIRLKPRGVMHQHSPR